MAQNKLRIVNQDGAQEQVMTSCANKEYNPIDMDVVLKT